MTTEIPWALLGSGTSTAAVILVVYLFLAQLSVQRREFLESLQALSRAFGDRVQVISEDVCDSNARVEQTMRDVAVELRAAAKERK